MYPHQFDRLIQALDASGARALIATSAANVQYLTGFSSPAGRRAPGVRLGIFTPQGTALVVPAIEVAAAIDARADVDHVTCYGRVSRLRSDAVAGDGHRVEQIFRDAAAAPPHALAEALAWFGVDEGSVAIDEGGLTSTARHAIAEQLAAIKLVSGDRHLAAARRVKSPYELERCASALRIAEEALDAVIQALERGTTEREAADLYASEVVKRGATPTWADVGFGNRTWMPTAWPTDQALRPGALVRLDVGCAHRGYSASVARAAVLGEPAARVLDVYTGVHEMIDEMTSAITEGATPNGVVAPALAMAPSLGPATEPWTEVGYGIGIEPRESPTLDVDDATPLAAGEVLCLELPYREVGDLGIVIRNTVLVMTAGPRVLNQSRDDLVVLD